MTITKETLITTIILVLALTNQVLQMFGISPIPIEDEQVQSIISILFTIASSLWAWWHNNSITKEAQAGDIIKDALKEGIIDFPDLEAAIDSIEAKKPNLYVVPATNSKCFKANEKGTAYKLGEVKGILVHDTSAGNPYLKRYVQPSKDDPEYEMLIQLIGENEYGNSWNEEGDTSEKMVHAFVGLLADGTVATAEILPLNYACWDCGSGANGTYNKEPNGHLQIEICDDGYESEEYFTKVVKGEAVRYVALLCKEHGLTADDVCDHYEAHKEGYASDHSDITEWLLRFGYTMNDFRAWVRELL